MVRVRDVLLGQLPKMIEHIYKCITFYIIVDVAKVNESLLNSVTMILKVNMSNLLILQLHLKRELN